MISIIPLAITALAGQTGVLATNCYEVKVGDTTVRCFVYDVQHKRLYRADGTLAQLTDLDDVPPIEPRFGISPTPKLAIIVRAVGAHRFAGVPWVDVLGHGPMYMDRNTSGSEMSMIKPDEESDIDVSSLTSKTVDAEFHFSTEWKTVGTYDVKTGKSKGVDFHPHLKVFGEKRVGVQPWGKVEVKVPEGQRTDSDRIVAIDDQGDTTAADLMGRPRSWTPELSGKGEDPSSPPMNDKVVKLELHKAVFKSVLFKNVRLNPSQ